MGNIVLGKNLEVKPLCIGTWAWGDKLFWDYGNKYGEAELEAAFKIAIEAGVEFFDTAEVYGLGLSEKLLSKFINKTDKPVQIATKYGPLPWRINGKSVSDALTQSLKRLKRDKVELYQVHWPFAFFMSQETLMNALADEVERGRIMTVGVSNYSAEQMTEAHNLLAKRGIPLAVNQVRYSLLSRQIESTGIYGRAKELEITLLAYSPLAQGLLTGKYSSDATQTPTGARKIDPRFSPEGLQKIEPVIFLLQNIANKNNRTPAQVALNWLITKGNVIPIAGAKTASQVQQNIGCLDWNLNQEEMNSLDEASLAWL